MFMGTKVMAYAIVDTAKMFVANNDVGLRFRSFAGGAKVLTSEILAQKPTEYHFQADPAGIHISAQYFLSGEATILMGDGRAAFWSENGMSIIRSDTPGFRLRVDAGQTLRHVCVAMYHHDLTVLQAANKNRQMMRLMAVGDPVDIAVPVPAGPGMRKKAEALHMLSHEDGISGLRAEAMALEFLADALEMFSGLETGIEPQGDPAPWQREAAQHIRRAIDAEPLIMLDAAALFDRFGVGSSMAGRVFRAEVGMTLNAYQRRARLGWARDALWRGETVKSIAFACGYTHLGNFTRAYRQEFGESPTETRLRARHG